jgi:hypothetical protein
MEVLDMVMLFLTPCNGRKARRPDDWLRPKPSGLGRLLGAATIVAMAVWLLDHEASTNDAARASQAFVIEVGS